MNRKLQQPLEPENLDPVKMVEEAEEMLSQGKLPDSHFLYRLKGVVVHTGSADSGHYYSFIQDQDKKWFEFNDDRVTPFDPSRLPEESYGGKDEEDVKIKNAYMLFYERIQNDPLVPSLLTKQEN